MTPSAQETGDAEQLVDRARRAVDDASTEAALGEVENAFLGKRGELARAQRALGSLDPDQRREAGRELNAARARLEALLSDRRASLHA
ncbi:MAG TPA: phenylalanine--tRNA ligase subunit alpha, partial [Acidimicrobiales bacterium]|nr:phenylalanine--tRNA ligase subunit alpha [Acidimicrobiales bacterium]